MFSQFSCSSHQAGKISSAPAPAQWPVLSERSCDYNVTARKPHTCPPLQCGQPAPPPLPTPLHPLHHSNTATGPAAVVAVRTTTGCTARGRGAGGYQRGPQTGGRGGQGPRGGRSLYRSGPPAARGGPRGGHKGRWGIGSPLHRYWNRKFGEIKKNICESVTEYSCFFIIPSIWIYPCI